MAKVIPGSQSSWPAPFILVPKGDGRKCLVNDYCALNEVTRKFIWPMPKVEDIFSQLHGAKYFSMLELMTGILKDFKFAIPYLDSVIIFSRRTPQPHQTSLRKTEECTLISEA